MQPPAEPTGSANAPVESPKPSWRDRLSMIPGFGRPDEPPAPEPEPEPEPEPTPEPKQEPEPEPAAAAAAAEDERRYTLAELEAMMARRKKEDDEKRLAAEDEDKLEKLRVDDPIAYAEEMGKRKAERAASQAQEQQFVAMAKLFDGALIDPLMTRLSAEDRKAVMAVEGAGVGIDGRKAMTEAAVERLVKSAEARGEERAEQKLRKNEAFRKELLNELRSSPEFDEPELAPGVAARRHGTWTIADIEALSDADYTKHRDEILAQLG